MNHYGVNSYILFTSEVQPIVFVDSCLQQTINVYIKYELHLRGLEL